MDRKGKYKYRANKENGGGGLSLVGLPIERHQKITKSRRIERWYVLKNKEDSKFKEKYHIIMILMMTINEIKVIFKK